MYKNLNQNIQTHYDAIVVGAGHAGLETSLALSRMGKKVLVTTLNLDSVGFLPCNPSIGGTGKSHLVREVDALDGLMGKVADKTTTQLRMLNSSKGLAVQSLRAQVDKYQYHQCTKKVLENDPNIVLKQCEVVELILQNTQTTLEQNLTVANSHSPQNNHPSPSQNPLSPNNHPNAQCKVIGIKTKLGQALYAQSVILCCGVYLDSQILIGKHRLDSGPSGFMRSSGLGSHLKQLGLPLRRFKTGTPARINSRSIDKNQFAIQQGETDIGTFSDTTKKANPNTDICYLGHTNETTHQIIASNLSETLKYSEGSDSKGARYCPSIEDKIVRFKDKHSHQFFLESEGIDTNELYVQGISTALPPHIQEQVYKSIKGLEQVEIMRDAYAIEYECIDPTALYPTLMNKTYNGLFFAGQLNGTSGYEEAAAQGIVAGINAARYIDNQPPVIFDRHTSYIGVMIDDLVTVGTDEPYRMMTSRSENRLFLRQDNASFRLTQLGVDIGVVATARKNLFNKHKKELAQCQSIQNAILPLYFTKEYFDQIGESLTDNSLSVENIIKREKVNSQNLYQYLAQYKGGTQFAKPIQVLAKVSQNTLRTFIADIKYKGYIDRLHREQNETIRLQQLSLNLPTYQNIPGLSAEAIEKLTQILPLTISQASRIPGINPTDINALIIHIKKQATSKG